MHLEPNCDKCLNAFLWVKKKLMFLKPSSNAREKRWKISCFKVFINIQDDNLNNPQRLTASEENVW